MANLIVPHSPALKTKTLLHLDRTKAKHHYRDLAYFSPLIFSHWYTVPLPYLEGAKGYLGSLGSSSMSNQSSQSTVYTGVTWSFSHYPWEARVGNCKVICLLTL